VLKRDLQLPPEHLFPTDEWRIVESRFSERFVARAETVFALSNGYVGVRGTFDEQLPCLSPGTYVNGFHETWPIAHAEEAYGLARTGQTIVNVPDATALRLYVDDEPLFVPTANLRSYERALDMRAGILTRELHWSTPAGKHVLVRSCRLVSFEHRHVVATSMEVVVDRPAPVVITSEVVNRDGVSKGAQRRDRRHRDPRLRRTPDGRVLSGRVARVDEARLLLGYETTRSGMTLGVGIHHVLETAADHERQARLNEDGDGGEVVFAVRAQPDIPIRVTKYGVYQTSRSAPPAELVSRCERTLERVAVRGFEDLVERQRGHLERFWSRADVRVSHGKETARMQQAIRWNLFQVAQATWRAEGSGVPAKGLTGPGYDGHYFWDTEIYLVPMLAYTQPRIARNLLRFRHSMLPQARRRARDLHERGALFPWRTINGEEASAYYQAGTAQYHINADVVHALERYGRIHGDEGVLEEIGAEILVETARLWVGLGFHADDGDFHIHGVTGPDEYTTVVNDNTYTNLMARSNLRLAAEVVRRLAGTRPEAYAALAAEVDLDAREVGDWERAADAMHVPFDQRRGIHPQDAHFLEREVWDLDATPPERFPLLLHYHPLVIYRHQVIKQADIVLAMFLLGDEFLEATKRGNFLYYDALTTGDSSLSAAVESIMASEIGEEQRAREYFRFALLMDLADVEGNVSDGVHVASAAGVWQALVFGFGGVRDFRGRLSITPHLPSTWDSLAFTMRFRERQIDVHLTHEQERIELREGEPLELSVRHKAHVLTVDEPVVLSVEERAADRPLRAVSQ
jgi:alpha,alpha-trehalose phosphorylase